MTLVYENPGRHHYGGISFDSMYHNNMHNPSPQFSDPWSHQAQNSSAQAYSSIAKTDASRPALSMPYSQMPPVSAPLASDIPRSTYHEQPNYSAAAPSSSAYATSYPSMNYAQSLAHQQQQQHDQQRKLSSSDTSRAANASFGELDASRGMLALSHQNIQDLTPRNIAEARVGRGSTDSYGFPAAYSHHSSISNESGRGYPYYASSVTGSITDSATDYSSAASDAGYDSMASRTLPRPNGLLGASLGPPARESMMGQFSSKLSANTQKKHKCKVCDKRFTRPSSLQTHMYSHTGEKPFACTVEGCGRNFSVVSNLRRHKKVHKNESGSTTSDNDD